MEITEAQAKQMVRDAYQPEECDQCEGIGNTCWECANDALDDCTIVVIL